MLGGDAIGAALEKAFRPYRCVVQVDEGSAAAQLTVFGLKDYVLLDVPRVPLGQIDTDEALQLYVHYARAGIVSKHWVQFEESESPFR